MSRFRILDGNYAGYQRTTADTIGTVGAANVGTKGSPILNEAQAKKNFNYTPPTPPVVPPSGFQFYRLYFDTYGNRLYLSEISLSLAAVFDAGQLVTPSQIVVPTAGGNLASPTVLFDGAWPSPFWSGPTAGEMGAYTMIGVALPQASPIRSIRVRTGDGGGHPATARVDKSNDPNPFSSHPFNGKDWTIGGVLFPTWTLFDSFNAYTDFSVDPGT